MENRIKGIRTAALTIFASSALCFLWLGMSVCAADVELDLTKGDIEISSDGYRQGDGKKKTGPA